MLTFESNRRITRDGVLAAAAIMSAFPRPWFVSGGWALDLFVGHVTREHEDLEIGIARADQSLLHDFLAVRACRTSRSPERTLAPGTIPDARQAGSG